MSTHQNPDQVPFHSPENRSESTSKVDPYKWPAIGLCALFLVTLPIVLGIVVGTRSGPPSHGVAVPQVSIEIARARGERVYQDSCMVCHGPQGDGIPRLGKPLRNSGFVQNSSEEELFENIALGRMPDDPLNTTGMLMPPRGAKQISDDQIRDVVAYLRALQDPSQPTVSLDDWNTTTSQADSGENPASESSMVISSVGRDLFIASCSACHGAHGEGIEGLGKPFTTSEFVASKTDKELTTMIKMGRPIWDAENTTGIDMPPKGGNPALSDDELADIITYIRAVSSTTDE